MTTSPPSFPTWLAHCPRWVAEAEALTPPLHRQTVRPERVVTVHEDANGFQGWEVVPAAEPDPADIANKALGKGDSFVLDFAEHRVGFVRLHLKSDRWFNDAPVRLRLVFGEVPAEVAEPLDPYPGWLSRAWLQDVQVDVDELPTDIVLPRRYAFRYLRVDVVDTSQSFRVKVSDVVCETVTSAGEDHGTAPDAPEDRGLDAASLHTLRQCMQSVFEDGPKRDRRLWLGDLRLQALTNAVSFQNYDLVKRCLLLHAGFARPEDGIVPACVYEFPRPSGGRDFILDYSALFGPTLLDYARASGDLALAEELWPVARHQLDYCLRFVDRETSQFRQPPNWWLFLDWHPDLHKESALHAVLIYCLRRTAQLGELIGQTEEARRLNTIADAMVTAARTYLRDPVTGLYTSGSERQVSWATQAWMVLAGVPETATEAGALFDALPDDAIRPAGPYLWHHVVDALYTCGRQPQGKDLLRSYWGAMLKRGATTFFEVFAPDDERLSPYGSPLVNSYCHAWSCTPAYFLRGGHSTSAVSWNHTNV